jgi:hypothetical protein
MLLKALMFHGANFAKKKRKKKAMNLHITTT